MKKGIGTIIISSDIIIAYLNFYYLAGWTWQSAPLQRRLRCEASYASFLGHKIKNFKKIKLFVKQRGAAVKYLLLNFKKKIIFVAKILQLCYK